MQNVGTDAFVLSSLSRFLVKVDDNLTQEFEVEGHDLLSLLYAYLDEFLYRFSVEGFICKKATLLHLHVPDHVATTATATTTTPGTTTEGEGQQQQQQPCRLHVRGEGETFDLEK